MSLPEAASAVFFDRNFLMPPPPRLLDEGDNDEEDQPEASSPPVPPVPSMFYMGVKINIIQLARAVVVNICDVVPADQSEEEQEKYMGQLCVNMCMVPSLGSSSATVPRPGGGDVSTTTLMEAAAGGTASSSGAPGGGGSTSSDPAGGGGSASVQECIGRSVAERLITRCQRNAKKGDDEKKLLLCDKIVIANCGLGLGTGINPKEGAEFFSAALSSPMLVGGIVQAASGLLKI